MSDDSADGLAIGTPPPKSKAAQLLELLPAIEAAARAGHSHATIHNHLVKSKGLDLTFRYYELTLSRLRKKIRTPDLQPQSITSDARPNNQNERSIPVPINTTPEKTGASKIQDVLFGSASDFFS